MTTKAARTRQRVLARAMELFIDQGVAATPLREIAEGLEYTKAALYYHFPSKDDLLVALITPLHADLGAVLAGVEDDPTPTEPTAVLAQLLDVHLAHTDALRLSHDPAVRLVDRLGARTESLHNRAVTALIGVRTDAEDRLRAAAALAVLDDLAQRCPPDQHDLARRIGPHTAEGALHAMRDG